MLPGSALPASPDEIDDLARLWHREWALSPVALCVEVDPAGRDADAAAALATRLSTPVLIRAREAVPALDGHGLVIDIDPPTMAERHVAWQQHLPSGSAADPGALAAQFTLDTATIAAAAADPDPWARCRVLTRPHLGGYAQRLAPKAGWADLVLGEQELRLLHGIADQVRNRWRVYEEWGFAEMTSRGLGLSVLLSGPSGVGKTLATEVLARELDVDLYRTDLSAVVSKYIGETEKNLRQLFDAAEASGALLLFDEADALFGKRTEVREAHDRFANIQIDYLLQRMEAYHGLAVLSTNMRVRPGPRVPAAAAVHRRVPVPGYRPAPGDLGAGLPGASPRRRWPGPGPAGGTARHRRHDPQHRHERGVPGRRRRPRPGHGQRAQRGQGRVRQAPAADPATRPDPAGGAGMRIEVRIGKLVADDLGGCSQDDFVAAVTRELRLVLARELGGPQPANMRSVARVRTSVTLPAAGAARPGGPSAGRAVGGALGAAVTSDRVGPGARGPR